MIGKALVPELRWGNNYLQLMPGIQRWWKLTVRCSFRNDNTRRVPRQTPPPAVTSYVCALWASHEEGVPWGVFMPAKSLHLIRNKKKFGQKSPIQIPSVLRTRSVAFNNSAYLLICLIFLFTGQGSDVDNS